MNPNYKLLLLLMILLLTSCSKTTNQTPTSTTDTLGYPAIFTKENQLTNPGYPVGTDDITPTRTQVVIPTPNSTTGVVSGKLLTLADNTPITFTSVYLGEKLFLSNGTDYLITLQEKSSPHGETDQNGVFVISDVPAGEYIILLFTPRKSTPVIDEETGKEVTVLVETNVLLELPTYKVSWP
ncbi:MAG: hypothetical protein ACYDH1_01190 [Anaerolineaceae bacterium]